MNYVPRIEFACAGAVMGQDGAGEVDCGGGKPAGGVFGDASFGVGDGAPDGVSCGGCVWIGGTLDFFWLGR
jgi:hypothetical protein